MVPERAIFRLPPFTVRSDILASPETPDTTSGNSSDPNATDHPAVHPSGIRLEYATVWEDYRQAGWPSILPLPPGQKSPPPRGWTGEGAYPSYADMWAWADDAKLGGALGANVALRLPDGIIGIDVDAYGSKSGAITLRRAEETVGPLPPTWRSSARPWPSGIRFYRVPAGTRLRGQLGPGVEIVQRHHRYAVVWPSIHPGDAHTPAGARYEWHVAMPTSDLWAEDDLGDLPVAGDQLRHELPRLSPPGYPIPDLPAAWVEHLREETAVNVADPASTPAIRQWVAQRDRTPACDRMNHALDAANEKIALATREGGLHDVARDAVWHVCQLAIEGHAGLQEALADLMTTFQAGRELRGDRRGVEDAPREWRDILGRAVAKMLDMPVAEPCACSWGAEFGLPDQSVNMATGEVMEALAPSSGAAALPPELPVDFTVADFLGLDSSAERTGRPGPPASAPTGETMSPPPVPVTAAGDPYAALYLDADALHTIPRAERLIGGVHGAEGIIDRHTLTLLVGRDRSYKSFIALDWACCVASGTPWLGCPAERGRVLYVVGEGAYGMDSRKNAWKATHPGAELAGWLTIRRAPVNLWRRGPDFQHLLKFVYEGQYRLVIFDTLRRNSSGADNNSEKDAGMIVEALDGVRRATAAGSVLLVAHSGKDDRDTRGSSVFEDDADIVWRVKRDEDAELVSLWQDKRKDGPEASRRNLYPQQVDGTGSLVMVDRRNSAMTFQAKAPTRSLQVLEVLGRSIYADQGATTGAIKEACGWSGYDGPSRALSWLKDEGYVNQESSGRNSYWSITDKGRTFLVVNVGK